MAKWVYKFEEGSAAMRNLLGGKGCNLAEMTNLGMPIPQGFTVTTEACTDYYNSGKQITKEIQDQIFEALTWLEGVNGKKFGDTEDPLLVSVRSGARASMPGMMDTILNLGLNDVAVEGFAKKTGNPRFAYDSYRRFIQMYSDVVMEVPKSYFEKIIDEMKEAKGVHYDTELDANDLKELAEKFKAVYKEAMNGEEFPQDPKEQLMAANLDYAFLVMSLNDNFNLNRAVRYAATVLQEGIQPVAVLTKADLCEDVESLKMQFKQMLPQIKVHAVSALTGDGMDELNEYLQPGITIAFLGSSGVGKSTLVNALAGTEVMKTGGIREKDAKGRHTTTYRNMIELPSGMIVIDTPGMREIGLCDVDEGLDDTFEDIAELAMNCRFRDCTHTNEPRCAVRQAIEDGSLSQERFELYRSLHEESRRSADMKAIAKARKEINRARRR